MSAFAEVFLCDAVAVQDGGKGVRFPVRAFGADATGFAVRYAGKVYAYLNRCAHVPVELDWFKGEFFESDKQHLMCSTHGAIYAPESGVCTGGPCRGGRLRPIAVRDDGIRIYWQPDQQIQAPDGQTG
jgi:nitrite reductase/ring-hydroxylating ferredoxin subunit